MSAAPGDVVRLVRAVGGMPAGSEGVLVGWYVREEDPQALISFWDAGPTCVPVDAYEQVGRRGRWSQARAS